MASNHPNIKLNQHPILTCDEIILVVDEHGKILDANPTCVNQFGMNTNKIINSNFDTYFEISGEQRTLLLNNIAEEKAFKFESHIRGVDRPELPVYVSVSPAKTNAQSHVATLIAIDFTSCVKNVSTLKKKANQQVELMKTAGHLTESLDLKNVLEQIGRGARGMLGASGCSIYLLEQNEAILTPCISLASPCDEELHSPISVQNSYAGQAVKAKRGLIFNQAGIDLNSFHIPNTSPPDDERLLVVPFIVGDVVLGAMCMNRRGDIFTDEDLALAGTFATYAATALKFAQSHDSLLREVEERSRVENALNNTEHEQAIIRYRSAH